MRLLVVVVAFNSEQTLPATMNAVAKQLSRDDTLCVVDNASRQPVALTNDIQSDARIQITRNKWNAGFTGGNNIGLRLGKWRDHEAVLLLNPDLILPPNWVSTALAMMSAESNAGILSGPLIRYDFQSNRALEILDSTGIGRGGFLRSWLDLHTGQPRSVLLSLPQRWNATAICGALMLLPRGAIAAVSEHGELFDNKFFAYKEDIDLSLRISRAGFDLLVDQDLIAYHGRGWGQRRSEVPHALRKLSARNEVYLHYKHRSPYLLLSLLKASYVYTFEQMFSPIVKSGKTGQ